MCFPVGREESSVKYCESDFTGNFSVYYKINGKKRVNDNLQLLPFSKFKDDYFVKLTEFTLVLTFNQ